MSDKNKLRYYFTAKSTFSYETCDTHQITTMDKDINSTNEVIVLSEIDGNSLTSSSTSIVTSFEFQNQESENLNLDDRLITTIIATKDNHESLSDSSRVNSFKRDPGRGPEAAREFLLLGPYQPITTFPTVNRRHFCLNWYKVYNWVEFSEMNKNAYCFVCRLAYSHGHCDDTFTKNGFSNWSKTISKFNKHQASVSHKHANDSYVNAIKNHANNIDVLKLIDTEH